MLLIAVITGTNLAGARAGGRLNDGARVSIADVYDVFTLSVSRLSFALARDGLFPAPFAGLHHRFVRRGPVWLSKLGRRCSSR